MSCFDDVATLPDPVADTGILYLGPPVSQTYSKLRGYFEDQGLPYQAPMPDVLAVELGAGRLNRLTDGLPGLLGDAELNDTLALIVEQEHPPTLSDMTKMKSLASLISRVESEWLLALLRDRRLVAHCHPVVHRIPEGKVFGYEALVRGYRADGSMVFPQGMFVAAKASGVVHQLDSMARILAVRSFAESKLSGKLFLNFCPTAFYDPASCLLSTLDVAREAGLAPSQLVFEIVHCDVAMDLALVESIVAYLRDRGTLLSLDDFGSGSQSTNLLCKLRPDFIKLDMHLIRNVDRDPARARLAVELVDLAQMLGAATVAEGVETEGEWRWIKEHGVDYAQGFLFGRPVPFASVPTSLPVIRPEPVHAES
jgi:EAL domain-containing protein (putative c-di-GMP-specific phosphodiesterase class I)